MCFLGIGVFVAFETHFFVSLDNALCFLEVLFLVIIEKVAGLLRWFLGWLLGFSLLWFILGFILAKIVSVVHKTCVLTFFLQLLVLTVAQVKLGVIRLLQFDIRLNPKCLSYDVDVRFVLVFQLLLVCISLHPNYFLILNCLLVLEKTLSF
jgi:hypothetical protein